MSVSAANESTEFVPIPTEWRCVLPEKPDRNQPVFEQVFVDPLGLDGYDPIGWIWPQVLPRRSLTLLAGMPGVGKSYLALDIAARFTSGQPWPRAAAGRLRRGVIENESAEYHRVAQWSAGAGDGQITEDPEEGDLDVDESDASRRVLIVSSEDDLAETMSYRFISAGGDDTRCQALMFIVESDKPSSLEATRDYERRVLLDRDLRHLKDVMKAWHGVDLIIVDPIVGHVEGPESEQYLRHVLTLLADFCQEHDVAILAISHLRRDPAKVDIYQALGSRALAAIPRTIWTVLADPGDYQRRMLLPLKMNLGPMPPGLSFRFGPERLEWCDRPIHRMASDPSCTDNTRGVLDEAMEFIRTALAERDIPAVEMMSVGQRCGFGPATLHRAKKALNVRSFRNGYGENGAWCWSLTQLPEDATQRQIGTSSKS
ncbi:MAG: AAA family ATPase [Planctomycetales bacterium]